MKFKDWFNEKLITVKNKADLDRLYCHILRCHIDILKHTYNAYKHTGILDLKEVCVIRVKDDEKNFYYLGVDDEYLNFDSIFNYIRSAIGYEIMKDIDKEFLRKVFMFSFDNPLQELQPDDKYYFLITINPAHYALNYVERIEDLIGPYITHYTSVSELLDEFIELMNTNDTIRYTISTIWEDFGIIAFESEENFYNYIKERSLNKELSNGISVPITKDEMRQVVDQLKNNNDVKGIVSSILSNKTSRSLLN